MPDHPDVPPDVPPDPDAVPPWRADDGRPVVVHGFRGSFRTWAGERGVPWDVAEAALFLASDRSLKTTGCVISVDGGVPGAFPR